MDDMIEIVARAIAREIGYDFDTLYEGKSEYIKDRGQRHDVNTPYKPDITAAARAALLALREPTEGMLRAVDEPLGVEGRMTRWEGKMYWSAMIDHALQTQEKGNG